ncbi:TPA: hypothetical protein ACKR0C_005220 [Pseudomonas aeruginosa]|uniref:hypothetical protein n=1 Tax=Pseudomonas aeruginosa TaxID=287 RepID=UPI0007175DB7|nr:hypothetical protein [Pseudomonas aeruginosa]EKN7498907.1 hypothetical protein [Pseudomonas aeruginosa]EKV5556886.1 hypothetical protein [Pseudomonas aeruginosa]EKW6683511.1 hypothetical protein [Pseudomonas aeruginosa]EKX3945654.1 hypothetical protein [Pseudomonas aeruginosa]ELL2377858.1 hypothetical protein [Pseudomonas aeruginosa]
MNFIACDGIWAQSNGAITCVGTLIPVAREELSQSGLSAEDADYLIGQTIVLFAVIFSVIIVRKALK